MRKDLLIVDPKILSKKGNFLSNILKSTNFVSYLYYCHLTHTPFYVASHRKLLPPEEGFNEGLWILALI